MKLEDAPAPGWYPDPQRRDQLRWWEGTDWTDARRSPATGVELDNAARSATENLPSTRSPAAPNLAADGLDSDKVVLQVREAAREEVERAADLFSRRARTAIDRARSVAEQYVSIVVRWLKVAVVVVAVGVIAWFAFQVVVQATLLEWLGDRIDNVTD